MRKGIAAGMTAIALVASLAACASETTGQAGPAEPKPQPESEQHSPEAPDSEDSPGDEASDARRVSCDGELVVSEDTDRVLVEGECGNITVLADGVSVEFDRVEALILKGDGGQFDGATIGHLTQLGDGNDVRVRGSIGGGIVKGTGNRVDAESVQGRLKDLGSGNEIVIGGSAG